MRTVDIPGKVVFLGEEAERCFKFADIVALRVSSLSTSIYYLLKGRKRGIYVTSSDLLVLEAQYKVVRLDLSGGVLNNNF